ncbi:MAG: DUF4102 domain-containing protein [Alphaproteobacteria bacterium]|nr:DUF4102 domain-containing protein [Alphaproteobacteria bacterium]
MARDLLSHSKIRAIKKPARLSDGGGLILFVRSAAGGGLRKSWVFRYRMDGKRRDVGLGPYPEIDLPAARAKRDELREGIRQGAAPKKFGEASVNALKLEELKSQEIPTVKEMAYATFNALAGGLKVSGTASRWMSPLRNHIFPTIGAMPITELNQRVLVKALRHTWKAKPETANKAIIRVELVLTARRRA